MENLDHKISWSVFIAFSVIVLGVVGYYCYQDYKDSKNEDTNQIIVSQTTFSPTPSSTASYSSSATEPSLNYVEVENVVKQFENLHKIKDNPSVTKMFALFIPAVTDSEKNAYDYLLGNDAGVGPRLNSTATFDYILKSYTLQNIAEEKCLVNEKCIGGGFTVTVKEIRNISTDNVGKNRKDVIETKIFLVKSQDGKYLIDKYYNAGYDPSDEASAPPQKYEGFYIY